LKGVTKTYSQIVDEQVFQPLGMTRSSVSLNSTSAADLAATAVPHEVAGAPEGQTIERKAMVNFLCSKVSGCNLPCTTAETTSLNHQPIAQYGGA
jgi:CubicO group peptidase (beta-lactamase class C family)